MDRVMKLFRLPVPVGLCRLRCTGILEAEVFRGVYRKSKLVVLILAGHNAWHVNSF